MISRRPFRVQAPTYWQSVYRPASISRCRMRTGMPSSVRAVPRASAMATERCLPPVQPMRTLRLAQHVVRAGRITTGQGPEFRDVVGIGDEADVQDQVASGSTVLETERAYLHDGAGSRFPSFGHGNDAVPFFYGRYLRFLRCPPRRRCGDGFWWNVRGPASRAPDAAAGCPRRHSPPPPGVAAPGYARRIGTRL